MQLSQIIQSEDESPVKSDDFTKMPLPKSDNLVIQSSSNENNNAQHSILDINRLSNVDRLRLLLKTSLNANDFSLLGRLDGDNNESMIKGMAMDQIEEIPTKILTKDLNEDCVVCLQKLQKNDQIRVLPCEHHFHSDCIDLWLRRRSHCPMCKIEINADHEYYA